MGRFREDLARYRAHGESISAIALNPAVWALAWYRFGYAIYHTRLPRLLMLPFKIIYRIGYLLIEITTEMCLSPRAEIGGGLYMTHVGGIHLHPNAVIGKNCDLGHRVTIGDAAGTSRRVPRLGDNVYVGNGATIIGGIQIGDGGRVAANSLVMTNVPPGATVMGVPARVVMRARVQSQTNN
jgi:serine O-acetyltransferase